MAYDLEDEVDWSDSPLEPEPPKDPKPTPQPTYRSPIAESDDELGTLFVSETVDPYEVPSGTHIPSALQDCDGAPTLSRAQRARIGVHLNRREPTREDYSNFALYQANQKAYEAAFLKHFVAHALQPDHIRKCLEDDDGSHEKLETYISAVTANVSHIANKLTWNAHHRAVNLLANDGRHSAPFLDTHSFDGRIFSDFCPDNTILVARKLNESWHRTHVQPAMVRYTTKDYPVGQHSSPLEEIDDVTDTLFKNEAFAETLPTGRAVKLPTTKKATGRNLPGAAVRDDHSSTSRNWLFVPPTTHTVSPPLARKHDDNEVVKPITDRGVKEPRLLEDSREMVQYEETPSGRLDEGRSAACAYTGGSTQLEQLFERYGSNALESDHSDSSRSTPSTASLREVFQWQARLIEDHKRRLAERYGYTQTQQRPLSGIHQVVAEALARGLRPTTDNFDEQVKYIAAREHHQADRSTRTQALLPAQGPDVMSRDAMQAQPYQAAYSTTEGVRRKVTQNSEPPRKRHKLSSAEKNEKLPSKEMVGTKRKEKFKTKSLKQTNISPPRVVTQELSIPHPSGSTTLALHQILPPDAYFEPRTPDEQPAWRCGIKHAMGNYYNAGNRSACPGCFVNINHMKMTRMDFYLPASTHFFQPAPDKVWTPSKVRREGRRSKALSHNSIAKDAYWAAIQAGETVEQARQMCVDAVLEHLRPAPPKEPTKEPTPSPEPDLGPHPSGSTTMEHGQDIPECAYFEKQERHEEFAWRCDLNHALGRYYIAGNKTGCPGCGSYFSGAGKHARMDFYLPAGEVVRQEAPGLVKWSPRKPNKKHKPCSGAKTRKYDTRTHNQLCSAKYFEAVQSGHSDHKDALATAIANLEAELNAKVNAKSARREDRARAKRETSVAGSNASSNASSSKDVNSPGSSSNDAAESVDGRYRSNSRGGCTVSLVPLKRGLSDDEDEEEGDDEDGDTTPVGSQVIEMSSDEGETSDGSDSE